MDLSLLDAWNLWWSGQQLTGHTLYGVPVLWLGRLGKLLAFLAGTTILLDVIGPARLMTWGRALRTEREGPYFIVGLLGVVLLGLLLLIVAVALVPSAVAGRWGAPLLIALAVLAVYPTVWLLLLHGPSAVAGFGALLERPRFERAVRVIAVPLFLLGFALDYLAS
ncbi:hypothetical protein [Nocardiopsis tropica]|jgi:hypothetical protein|uniref:DUF3995 domain-containing protein n=1 Tax=Nocardiopsis tropica TaxID=109330 RepID=A0ABV2A4M3_9ACTN|nr:hypothetical protein [Nocardiopsis tropica]